MFASAGALLQPRGLGWGRAVSPLDWVFTPNSCPVARGQPLDRPPKPTRPSPVSRHKIAILGRTFWRETADGGRRERRLVARPGRRGADRREHAVCLFENMSVRNMLPASSCAPRALSLGHMVPTCTRQQWVSPLTSIDVRDESCSCTSPARHPLRRRPPPRRPHPQTSPQR